MVQWVYWPTLADEIRPHMRYMTGVVLNGGCGIRRVELTHASYVINLDVAASPQTYVRGDLEHLPLGNQSVDSILSIAVLEHCRHPWLVAREFARVIKSGGRILCSVPFLQPVHACPGDYFRFTPDGLLSLLEDVGFRKIEASSTHGFFHVLGWLLQEALSGLPLLRIVVSPLAALCNGITRVFHDVNVPTAPSVVTVVMERT